jgi:hypothetical protein
VHYLRGGETIAYAMMIEEHLSPNGSSPHWKDNATVRNGKSGDRKNLTPKIAKELGKSFRLD